MATQQDIDYGNQMAAKYSSQIQGIMNLYMGGQTANESLARFLGSQLATGADIKQSLLQTSEYTTYATQQLSNTFNEYLGHGVDEAAVNAYKSMLLNGGSTAIINDIKKSDEYITQVIVPLSYWNTLGREPDPEGLKSWTQYVKDQIASGIAPDDVYNNLSDQHRNSQEYIDKGGRAGEETRDLVNMIEFPGEFPEFKWGEKEQNDALAYAEAYYGPYYANLIKELSDSVELQKTRLTEDTQAAKNNAQRDLNDYLAMTEEQRSRIESDYTKEYFRASEDLGLNIEQIAEQKLRNAEDFKVDTDRILQRYAIAIPQVIEGFAAKGMTFSGKRVQQELYTRGEQTYELQTGQKSYERSLADLERSEDQQRLAFTRTTEDLATKRERDLTDLMRNENLSRTDAEAKLAEIERTQSRGVTDLTEEQRLKQRTIGEEKQQQLLTGEIYGVSEQERRAREAYSDTLSTVTGTDAWKYNTVTGNKLSDLKTYREVANKNKPITNVSKYYSYL